MYVNILSRCSALFQLSVFIQLNCKRMNLTDKGQYVDTHSTRMLNVYDGNSATYNVLFGIFDNDENTFLYLLYKTYDLTVCFKKKK